MSEINIGAALARIDEQLSQVRSSIASLQVSVSGNGNPANGLLQRVDRIEQAKQVCQDNYNKILKSHTKQLDEIKEIANKKSLTRGQIIIEALRNTAIFLVLLMQFLK